MAKRTKKQIKKLKAMEKSNIKKDRKLLQLSQKSEDVARSALKTDKKELSLTQHIHTGKEGRKR